MSRAESELISMIRKSADPVQAIATAIQIISDYLKQHESSQERYPADLQEPA